MCILTHQIKKKVNNMNIKNLFENRDDKFKLFISKGIIMFSSNKDIDLPANSFIEINTGIFTKFDNIALFAYNRDLSGNITVSLNLDYCNKNSEIKFTIHNCTNKLSILEKDDIICNAAIIDNSYTFQGVDLSKLAIAKSSLNGHDIYVLSQPDKNIAIENVDDKKISIFEINELNLKQIKETINDTIL